MCSFAVVFVVPNADDTDLSHCGTKLREEIFKLTNHVGQQLDSAPQLIPGYGYGRRDINHESMPFGTNVPRTSSFTQDDVQHTLENSLWECQTCMEYVFGHPDGQRSPVYHGWDGIVVHTKIGRDRDDRYTGYDTQCLCGLCGARCKRVAPGYVDPHIDGYRARRSASAQNRPHYSGD